MKILAVRFAEAIEECPSDEKKKRLQMLEMADEQGMRRFLDQSVALELFERVGTDENGETLYRMIP